MRLLMSQLRSATSLLFFAFAFLYSSTHALGQGNAVPAPPPPGNDFNASGNDQKPNSDNSAQVSTAPSENTGTTNTDLIALEYRNAPLVDVIRTLADGANINVTLSAEVEKGSPVTIRLNKVTYEQALKAILETYKFGSVFEHGILKIDTLANLTAMREEKLKEKESTWKVQPTKRLIWQVNYAKASELKPILDTMLKGYSIDPRFSIVFDRRTNKLIIEGISDALVEAKAILENLDRRKQQVLIEARIVEASSELSKTLSITWGTRFGFDANRGLANGLLFPNSLTGNMGGAGALGGTAPGPGLATSPTQLGTLQFTVGAINNLVNIDAVLRAYETEALANVIASPRVVVQDQEKAVIDEEITLNRPILGPDGKPTTRDTLAKLFLQVAPQITSENTLELDIQVQRQTPTNAPSDPVQGAIKRQANTKLIVANGETAVIGGLYQTQKFKGQGRVPVLGRLPLIGALFRTNQDQSFRSELMVLITPRILPGGQPRPTAKADLPIIGGSSTNIGGRSNNNLTNSTNNVFAGNSNNGNSASAGPADSSGNKANNGGNDLGNANDFGPGNVGNGGNAGNGNGLNGNSADGAGTSNNGGGDDNFNNLGNNAGNNVGNNVGNTGNSNSGSGNGGGGDENFDDLNAGNGAANNQGNSGSNNLNNLNGGDL